MNKKPIIVFIKIESNHFNTRRVVEEELCGKSFESIDDLKQYCYKLELSFDGYYYLDEYVCILNDEEYPTDNWVASCWLEE